MQLIAQAFNAFITVNLANPDTCFDCRILQCRNPEYPGTIQGTVSEQDGTSLRRLQFAARFQFLIAT